ncbi:hypothetical protein Pelo_14738 [Pelomyxa schiedti]|nr:hypothetical protein Pelo_14738 [Pelomyxa schiedti]
MSDACQCRAILSARAQLGALALLCLDGLRQGSNLLASAATATAAAEQSSSARGGWRRCGAHLVARLVWAYVLDTATQAMVEVQGVWRDGGGGGSQKGGDQCGPEGAECVAMAVSPLTLGLLGPAERLAPAVGCAFVDQAHYLARTTTAEGCEEWHLREAPRIDCGTNTRGHGGNTDVDENGNVDVITRAPAGFCTVEFCANGNWLVDCGYFEGLYSDGGDFETAMIVVPIAGEKRASVKQGVVVGGTGDCGIFSVVVPLRDCSMTDLPLLTFNEQVPDELILAVFSSANRDLNLLRIDLQKTFTSRTLTVTSSTSCKSLPDHYVMDALHFTRPSGPGVFIVSAQDFRKHMAKTWQVEETTGNKTDLVVSLFDTTESSWLSGSRFTVCHSKSQSCEVWDCDTTTDNEGGGGGTGARTPAIVKTLSFSGSCSRPPRAKSGFVCYVVGNRVEVADIQSGITFVALTFPQWNRPTFAVIPDSRARDQNRFFCAMPRHVLTRAALSVRDQLGALAMASHGRCGGHATFRGKATHDGVPAPIVGAMIEHGHTILRHVQAYIVATLAKVIVVVSADELSTSRKTVGAVLLRVSPLTLAIMGDAEDTFPSFDWVDEAHYLVVTDDLRWGSICCWNHHLQTEGQNDHRSTCEWQLCPWPTGYCSNLALPLCGSTKWSVGFAEKECTDHQVCMMIQPIGRACQPQMGGPLVVVPVPTTGNPRVIQVANFNKVAPKDVLIVVTSRMSGDDIYFIIVDVNQTYTSRSLCVLGITHYTGMVLDFMWDVCHMPRQNDSYCDGYFIVHFRRPDFDWEICQLEETTGIKRTLVSSNHALGISWLGGSKFSIAHKAGSVACEVWDCCSIKGRVGPIPHKVIESSAIAATSSVEGPFLFHLVNNQIAVLDVVSSFTVVTLTFPNWTNLNVRETLLF